MRKTFVQAALVATLALVVSPPAQAWDDIWTGFTCGFTSTSDPTGQVIQDPNTQTGEIDGGPIVVVNQNGDLVDYVEITCALKLNYGENDGTNVAASRSSITAGNVGVLVDTVSYTALPGDDIYVCMDIHWCDEKGCWWIYLDSDDDPGNGNQCDLATSVEAR